MPTTEKVQSILDGFNFAMRDREVPLKEGLAVHESHHHDYSWKLWIERTNLADSAGGVELKLSFTINASEPLPAEIKLRLVARDWYESNFWGSALLVPGQTLRQEPDCAQWFTKLTLIGPDGKVLSFQLKLDH